MFPQIFGKYVLEREIAAGGMARVYLATLRGAGGFEKRLVVKQIRAELASDEAFVRRFVEEAKTAVELSHSNIVPVYELGVEQGVYFIAMELCEGASLAELLASSGALSPEEGAYVGIEICRALDYAHRRAGVVHRDVTPRNVMIDGEGAVRLIDFGIAAPVSLDGESGKRVEIFGSPGHMPPEQLDGRPLTAAADVFAVGALLIEAWTGKAPFRRASAQESQQALSQPPPKLEGDLAELGELVENAVALDPSERLASPEELARPLRRFVRTFDLGDVARRLGERVKQASERREQASAEPQAGADTPRLVTTSETRTFATRGELAEWTSPSTRKLPSDPDVGSITASKRPNGAGGWRVGLIAFGIVGALVWLGSRWLGEPAPSPAPPSPAVSTPTAGPSARVAASTPPSPSPAPSATASVRRPAPAAKPAPAESCRLSISSLPPGASASIDGRAHGKTPVSGVELSCGAHTVALEHGALGDRVAVPLKLVAGSPRSVIVDWSASPRRVIVQ